MLNKNFKKEDRQKKIKKLLEDQKCFVLLTCSEPSKDGQMNVEMIYEGEDVLASYLLESANHMFHNEE